MLGTAAVVARLAGGLAACSTPPTSPTLNPAFSSLDEILGTGTEAAAGNSLTVNYTGWLYDSSKADLKGLQFDSSLNAGRSPLVFVLGSGQVIKGWDQGVPGMKVGGVRRLIIPASLAYSNVRSGTIPPNATLVFEIELLDVQ
jgi:FKBP-type peptidyl-prolyl cis-trans isomerase FkpA